VTDGAARRTRAASSGESAHLIAVRSTPILLEETPMRNTARIMLCTALAATTVVAASNVAAQALTADQARSSRRSTTR
jgi:hypothetical protein